MVLINTCESEKIVMESILRARAEFMAERTAKDSATRGEIPLREATLQRVKSL